MQMRGYKPLLAHPERYPYLRLNDYQEYKQAGCLFQLNILSLTGHYGSHAKETAEELLENNLIDFVATDLHHMQHINLIYKYAAHEEKLFELKNSFKFKLGGNLIVELMSLKVTVVFVSWNISLLALHSKKAGANLTQFSEMCIISGVMRYGEGIVKYPSTVTIPYIFSKVIHFTGVE
jgi:hypothetical protein